MSQFQEFFCSVENTPSWHIQKVKDKIAKESKENQFADINKGKIVKPTDMC